MPWVRLDEHMPDHPKLINLSDRAFRVYITSLCYAAECKSPGTLLKVIARRLNASHATLRQLIDAGLWSDGGDHYVLEDYGRHHRIVIGATRPRIDRAAVAGDAIHIDHIIPFSKGGSSEVGNLQPAHADCNLRKGARAP